MFYPLYQIAFIYIFFNFLLNPLFPPTLQKLPALYLLQGRREPAGEDHRLRAGQGHRGREGRAHLRGRHSGVYAARGEISGCQRGDFLPSEGGFLAARGEFLAASGRS